MIDDRLCGRFQSFHCSVDTMRKVVEKRCQRSNSWVKFSPNSMIGMVKLPHPSRCNSTYDKGWDIFGMVASDRLLISNAYVSLYQPLGLNMSNGLNPD